VLYARRAFLTAGGAFTGDVIETWIEAKEELTLYSHCSYDWLTKDDTHASESNGHI
jgi:hypothetical protein